MSAIWVSRSRLCSTTFSASSIESSETRVETDVFGGTGAQLRDLVLDRRDALLAHAFCVLACFLDDPRGLAARLRELTAVLLE